MKIKEEEIRPEKIFNEYLRLTEIDNTVYFKNKEQIVIDCPACGNKGQGIIEKHGFIYEECSNCKTLFVNPRPIQECFDSYYTDSPSTKFWATTFYKETEDARREKLWIPKAKMVKELILENSSNENPINFVVDIGGGYGVFDEEIKQIMDITPIVIEPSVHLAEICRSKDLIVIEKFMEHLDNEELPNGGKCFVSFELFEHLYNPKFFLETVYKSMDKGDMFIFTTLSGMGLDIQVLGAHSKSVSPPHHLNFFNPKSIKMILLEIGFDIVKIQTPGKLDVYILRNGKAHIKDRFWLNFLDYSSEEEKEYMQKSISAQGLSSHMMMTCIKK